MSLNSRLATIEKKIKAIATQREQQAQREQSDTSHRFKCWEDFARTCQIRSSGKIVQFDPYPFQIALVRMLVERSCVIAKGRQLGVTETVINLMLYRASQNPGYLGVVFSKCQQDTSLLAKRARRMLQSTGIKRQTDSLTDLELEGGGRILFRNGKPESGRSLESVCDVLVDEAAWIDLFKDILDSVAPAQQMVGESARVWVVSTPNGRQGHYWDLLNNHNEGKDVTTTCRAIAQQEIEPFQSWVDSSGWGKVFIHWRSHPVYGKNDNFLEEVQQKQKLSKATVAREHNLNFEESAQNFFSALTVQDCVIQGLDREKERNKDANYFCGGDAATTGDDQAACVVLKKYPGKDVYTISNWYNRAKQASEYHLYHFGEMIRIYRPEAFGIEQTGGVGRVWGEQLVMSGHDCKVYFIDTTTASKALMLERVRFMLENGLFEIPEKCPLIEELLNFMKIENKLEAAPGKHDDLVMALAFAVQAARLQGYS